MYKKMVPLPEEGPCAIAKMEGIFLPSKNLLLVKTGLSLFRSLLIYNYFKLLLRETCFYKELLNLKGYFYYS